MDVFAAASLQLESGRTHPIDARVEVSSTGAIQLTWTVDISEIEERATGLVVAVIYRGRTMLTKSLRVQKRARKSQFLSSLWRLALRLDQSMRHRSIRAM